MQKIGLIVIESLKTWRYLSVENFLTFERLVQVEWTMQDVRGRPTTITEGNAKGSYVSYVIEEDVSCLTMLV